MAQSDRNLVFPFWHESLSAAATLPASKWIRIEQFINYFNATMARPFRWTYAGKPLAE
jgi:hypothetical protein